MVGGFELAGRLVMGVRAVVKAAVGERAAEPFVKEQEEQGDLNPFWGETVGVAGSVTLQQPVGFEFAQVVAELVEPVGAVGEVEGGEDGVVDLPGGPAADLTTAVQEDLEEADDTGVVDLDSGIADRANGDWKAEALQQREVDVDVEPLRLETGETAGNGLEALADGIEMVQPYDGPLLPAPAVIVGAGQSPGEGIGNGCVLSPMVTSTTSRITQLKFRKTPAPRL